MKRTLQAAASGLVFAEGMCAQGDGEPGALAVGTFHLLHPKERTPSPPFPCLCLFRHSLPLPFSLFLRYSPQRQVLLLVP